MEQKTKTTEAEKIKGWHEWRIKHAIKMRRNSFAKE